LVLLYTLIRRKTEGMSNVLKVSLQTTIYSVADRGWSQRRIASEVGINRETVRRYLRLAKPAISIADSEEETDRKPAISITGVGVGRRSRCENSAEVIGAKLEVGLSARPEEKPLLMLERAFLMILAKADLTSFRAPLKCLPPRCNETVPPLRGALPTQYLPVTGRWQGKFSVTTRMKNYIFRKQKLLFPTAAWRNGSHMLKELFVRRYQILWRHVISFIEKSKDIPRMRVY
jgi:predicted transcriptional regulator